MYATTGGSGGIPTDPSLQTGKDEEERLKDKKAEVKYNPRNRDNPRPNTGRKDD